MADGCVVVAGVFPAGVPCRLVRVLGPGTMRAEGGEHVETRLADGDGVVGFEGLEVGGSYFVCGYVGGWPLELRAKGHTLDELNEFLSQPPVGPLPQVVGTQEERVVAESPAERPDLERGVPAALAEKIELPSAAAASGEGSTGEAASGSAQENAPAAVVYVFTGVTEPAVAEVAPDWVLTNERIPDAPQLVEGTHAFQPLWVFRGAGEPDLTNWAVYNGPSEPLPPGVPSGETATSPGAETGSLDASAGGPVAPDAAALGADTSHSSSSSEVSSSGSAPDGGGAPGAVQAPPADVSEPSGPAAGDGVSSEVGVPDGSVPDGSPDGSATPPAGDVQQSAPAPSAWDHLVAQADALGVPNTASLSDEELRQSIIDKGATPVA